MAASCPAAASPSGSRRCSTSTTLTLDSCAAGSPSSATSRCETWHSRLAASISHSTSLEFSSKSRSSRPMTSFWRSASASAISRAPNRRAVDQTLATTISAYSSSSVPTGQASGKSARNNAPAAPAPRIST